MQVQSSGRSTEEESGNPLQYSCLENPMDRGAMSTVSQRVGNDGHTPLLYCLVSENGLRSYAIKFSLFCLPWELSNKNITHRTRFLGI